MTIRKTARQAGGRILPPLLLLLLALPAAQAQPLDTLVRRALERHPSLAAFRLSGRRAESAAQAARAWESPRAGVEFSMLPPLNPNPFTRGETMFMVEQEIPLFGRNGKMAEAMRAEAAVSAEELAGTELELRARIATEYYRLLLLERRAELNRESRALAEMLYADAETRYQVGNGSQADLYMIAIEIERLDAALRAIDVERRTARTAINALTFAPPDDTVIVADTLPLLPLPPFDTLPPLLEGNPGLKKMEAMARMSEAEAVAAEGMLDPMLMVRGGVAAMPMGHPVRMAELGEMVDEFHASGENSVERLGITAGVMVSLPLAPWSRSGPEAQAQAARIAGEEALLRKAAMRNDMIAMLRSEYGMAEEALVWIEHYSSKQIPLLEQSLKATRTDYMNGRASISALVEIYRMLTMAREEIAMRETEYATALERIREQTGGKWW